MNKRTIVLATNNMGKVKEMKAILGQSFNFNIVTMHEAGIYIDPEENEDNFVGNAISKAETIKKYTNNAVIADDSGLEVFALDNAPGVHSKRFYHYANYGTSNDEKINSLLKEESNIDELNNTILLRMLYNVPITERGAQFVSVISLIDENGVNENFKGVCKGHIALDKKGSRGFGYDPIFIPDGYDTTFAQMSDMEKNKISHRAKSLNALKEYLIGR